jgi:hypothetical protein
MEQVQYSQKPNGGRDVQVFGENHQGALFVVDALRHNYPFVHWLSRQLFC